MSIPTEQQMEAARDLATGDYVVLMLDDDCCVLTHASEYSMLEIAHRQYHERRINQVLDVIDLAGEAHRIPVGQVKRLKISTAMGRALDAVIDVAQRKEDDQHHKAAGAPRDDGDAWKEG